MTNPEELESIVIELRMHRWEAPTIAGTLNVSIRRVQQIIAATRPAPTPFDDLPSILRQRISHFVKRKVMTDDYARP